MQLGIRLQDTTMLPLEERIAQVHQLGFTCGDLTLSEVIDDFPVTDEALTPGLAMYIKRVFAQNEVDIAVLSGCPNLPDSHREQIAETIHSYMAHIRFASWLGCGVVGMETAVPDGTEVFVPECRTEAGLRTFTKNLRPIVKYAQKMGVVVAVEPGYRHIVYDSKCARQVLDEIGSPNLQIIFNPVSLLDAENYGDRQILIEEAMELLGPDIAAVRLGDCAVQNGRLLSMGCGQGEMDYTPILKFIRDHKPYIHTILEGTRPETNQRVKHFIARKYMELEKGRHA